MRVKRANCFEEVRPLYIPLTYKLCIVLEQQ
nr:MAG TPA: hypothetical protein [Caudoviricetes sp.]